MSPFRTDTDRSHDVDPVAFLSLIGHPLRWRLIGELAETDRTVSELCARVDEAQNLVSYHLRKLRDAGLAGTQRSSADGRDTFYRLELDRLDGLLSTAAGSIHPGLMRHSAEPTHAAASDGASVLFLCTGNSARSQIAEALLRMRSGGTIDAKSAGSAPKELHPNAVRVMAEDFGIDISDHRTKHLDAFLDHRFDRVVTLCDKVREVCPEYPGGVEPVHWSVTDPGHGEPDDERSFPAFRRTAARLDTRVRFLLAALTTDRQPLPKGQS